MLGCTETVTITHFSLDPQSGADTQAETVLTGVSWYGQVKAAAGAGGLTACTVYKIRIPAALCGGYTPPEAFSDAGWTLCPGDKVRHGSTQATVLAVHDNLRGRVPHLYVEAG